MTSVCAVHAFRPLKPDVMERMEEIMVVQPIQLTECKVVVARISIEESGILQPNGRVLLRPRRSLRSPAPEQRTSVDRHSDRSREDSETVISETESSVSCSSMCNGSEVLINVDESESAKRRRQDCVIKVPRKKKPVSKDSRDTYEVEKVLDCKSVGNDSLYLVKWKGWAKEYNTWEPLKNLTGCTRLLIKYFNQKQDDAGDSWVEIERLREELSTISCTELDRMIGEFKDGSGKLKLPERFDRSETEVFLKVLAKQSASYRDEELMEKVRNRLKLDSLLDRRRDQLASLKEWENEMNSLSQFEVPLTVVNEVDLDGPPLNFYYITDLIPGENVVIPEDPPFGCSCVTCDSQQVACCGRTNQNANQFPYNKLKRLRVGFGTPIYECNKCCKCGPECLNRVVQLGRKVKLSIFKTPNGCGWGVKTLEKVKKGTFVTDYVGEVLTNEEAERRGRNYDAVGRTYLFDLDFNDKENVRYTVDAANYGNVSHFINHSCEPNLHVYAVWVNCLDPDLPKLALFASRDIKSGEELSFDYHVQDESENASNSNNNYTGKYLCKCGSDKCRKYFF